MVFHEGLGGVGEEIREEREEREERETLINRDGEGSSVIKQILLTITRFIDIIKTVVGIIIEGFSIITDFIPYLTDSLGFIKFFLPFFLLIYIIIEIYSTL